LLSLSSIFIWFLDILVCIAVAMMFGQQIPVDQGQLRKIVWFGFVGDVEAPEGGMAGVKFERFVEDSVRDFSLGSPWNGRG
jgi:hypothetical protein